ncbi:unnamed protein product [Phytomonas sp. Hart1]|nr:unnamed protein product [Phytomonas sp. Hart1]|eukprot:CCW67745.1 unnamed protein product [Phytomonas sp. isolate Hart1]
MVKGTIKRSPTPSALRKKKAQQRIRKKMKAKLEKKKPNWKIAIAKVYTKDSRDRGSTGSKRSDRSGNVDLPRRKRGRNGALAESEKGLNDEDGVIKGDGDPDIEVQSDVDEEKQELLNQRDPLETQLFLKNLPLDTNEDELMSYFAQHFCRIKRVLLVRNRMNKMLTGTGFLHCGSIEIADKIFNFAQQNARELSSSSREEFKEKTVGMSYHQAKRMKFKLRNDTYITRDPFLELRESKFTVHRVLTRSDTQEAVSALEKKKKRTKVAADDPRNLYLLQEGLIMPDTTAARGLHPRYLQMIQDDYEARKSQLRNNNYFVSKTRLSVRNLPRTMSENDMRRLFSQKVRDYLKTHKADMEREKFGKYGPIKNVKVLKNSAGVSRGYGFIEFVNHNIALHVLRMFNNNPTIFGDQRRLIVSFAVEDINAIQKLQRMKELKRQRLANESQKCAS